jgi:hypothetical protein
MKVSLLAIFSPGLPPHQRQCPLIVSTKWIRGSIQYGLGCHFAVLDHKSVDLDAGHMIYVCEQYDNIKAGSRCRAYDLCV